MKNQKYFCSDSIGIPDIKVGHKCTNFGTVSDPRKGNLFINSMNYENNTIRFIDNDYELIIIEFDNDQRTIIQKSLSFMQGTPNIFTSVDSISPASNSVEIIKEKLRINNNNFTEHELGFIAYWMYRAYSNNKRRMFYREKHIIFTILSLIENRVKDNKIKEMISKQIKKLIKFSMPPNRV